MLKVTSALKTSSYLIVKENPSAAYFHRARDQSCAGTSGMFQNCKKTQRREIAEMFGINEQELFIHQGERANKGRRQNNLL